MDVSPARQVESPILELVSVSWQGAREETTEGGLVRGTCSVVVDLPSWVLASECREKESELGSQRRRNLLDGNERVTGP